MNQLPALLAFVDGTVFYGESIGIAGSAIGELVFNTSMTGYQEILTDPSYSGQIVTLTYPHIGNVGCNVEDGESSSVACSGLVIRDLPLLVSSWRSEESLPEFMVSNQVVGISNVDTRAITRKLREEGAQSACIMAGENLDEAEAIEQARKARALAGLDLAIEVTTKESYPWRRGEWQLNGEPSVTEPRFHVVAYDFGVKRNILNMLVERGCRVTVVPADTAAQTVLELKPDGVFLSNGPGDPEPCVYAIEAIQTLLAQNMPMFGICLGHQLLSLACGAKTVKMKFGHHGANHPVQDLANNQVMITSQNHGFAVDEQSLPADLIATHKSLFDGSLQGVRHRDKPAFGFQGHPEASPGPHDTAHLFDQFLDSMNVPKGR